MSLVQLKRTIDAAALQRDLESAVEGEVRFDDITRALYSTDASVYQIKPLGVVVARHREDVIRAFEVCRKHSCPVTMRGAPVATSGAPAQVAITTGIESFCAANTCNVWNMAVPPWMTMTST